MLNSFARSGLAASRAGFAARAYVCSPPSAFLASSYPRMPPRGLMRKIPRDDSAHKRKFSAMKEERNKELAKRLQSEAPSPRSYDELRSAMARFLSGHGDAPSLYDKFMQTYGATDESLLLYLEMAEILPDEHARAELLAAAGFDDRETPKSVTASESCDNSKQMEVGIQASGTDVQAPSESEPNVTFRHRQQADKFPSDSESTNFRAIHDKATVTPPAAESQPRTESSSEPVSAASDAQMLEDKLLSLGISPELLGVPPDDTKVLRLRGGSKSKKRKTGGEGIAVESSASEAANALATAMQAAQATPNVVYWLRQDFRTHDNPALSRAVDLAQATQGSVYFVYIYAPGFLIDQKSAYADEDGDDVWTGTSWRPTGASLLWLHDSLDSMDKKLQEKYGATARILYAKGPSASTLQQLCTKVSAGTVIANRRHEPAMKASDAATETALQDAGLRVEMLRGLLLHDPEKVAIDMKRWTGHFGTLMPFYRACEAVEGFKNRKLKAEPKEIPTADDGTVSEAATELGGLQLDSLQLYESSETNDWAAPIRAAWDISEAGGQKLLSDFIAMSLEKYESQRNRADIDTITSCLSPYLHFGQLSPQYMMNELIKKKCQSISKTFWRRLAWRDLAYWQLLHFPTLPVKPIRPQYENQEWDFDEDMLKAWQKGKTGFPLVDAGMRHLWSTGFLPQSIRMVVAAFLTEYLNMSWVHGARWFHYTLVDADLAINCMMWQNAGKSGLDPWNFTVLPTSKASDPSGTYIRKWVPELAKVKTKWIHAPWEAPDADLEAAGVVLGETYPHRVTTTSLKELRAKNVAALRAARKDGAQDSNGYDLIPLPEGAATGVQGDQVRVFTKPELRNEDATPGKGVRGAGPGVDAAAKARNRRSKGSKASKDKFRQPQVEMTENVES